MARFALNLLGIGCLVFEAWRFRNLGGRCDLVFHQCSRLRFVSLVITGAWNSGTGYRLDGAEFRNVCWVGAAGRRRWAPN